MCFKTIFCLSNTSVNGFQIDMMLLPCNSYTRNGRRKVTTANLQRLGEVLWNFLPCCLSWSIKSYGITPIGFNIKMTPCVGKPSKNFLLLWWNELAAAQFKSIELIISESVQKLFDLETEFIWKFSLYTVQEDWLLKTKKSPGKIWKETPFEKTQEN